MTSPSKPAPPTVERDQVAPELIDVIAAMFAEKWFDRTWLWGREIARDVILAIPDHLLRDECERRGIKLAEERDELFVERLAMSLAAPLKTPAFILQPHIRRACVSLPPLPGQTTWGRTMEFPVTPGSYLAMIELWRRVDGVVIARLAHMPVHVIEGDGNTKPADCLRQVAAWLAESAIYVRSEADKMNEPARALSEGEQG